MRIPPNSVLPEECRLKLGHFYQVYRSSGELLYDGLGRTSMGTPRVIRIPYEALEENMLIISFDVQRNMQYRKELLERGKESTEKSE